MLLLLLQLLTARTLSVQPGHPQSDFNERIVVAAKAGELEEVQGLCTRPEADLGYQNFYGNTALHLAALGGHTAVVELLLAHDSECIMASNVSIRTQIGRTPLHLAAMGGRLEASHLLLDSGAEVNAATPDGETPLHLATMLGFMNVTELLIQRGADIHATTAGIYETVWQKVSKRGSITGTTRGC